MRVTVFDVALPFLGVTVTVTLHDPAFSAFTDVPDTLQNFDDAAATFTLTFAPAATVIFADFASDDPVVDLPTLAVGAVVPEVDGDEPEPDVEPPLPLAGTVVVGLDGAEPVVVTSTRAEMRALSLLAMR